MNSWPFSALLMYFQLGRVRAYTDFHVWRNIDGILATSVHGAITTTTGLNALPKL